MRIEQLTIHRNETKLAAEDVSDLEKAYLDATGCSSFSVLSEEDISSRFDQFYRMVSSQNYLAVVSNLDHQFLKQYPIDLTIIRNNSVAPALKIVEENPGPVSIIAINKSLPERKNVSVKNDSIGLISLDAIRPFKVNTQQYQYLNESSTAMSEWYSKNFREEALEREDTTTYFVADSLFLKDEQLEEVKMILSSGPTSILEIINTNISTKNSKRILVFEKMANVPKLNMTEIAYG